MGKQKRNTLAAPKGNETDIDMKLSSRAVDPALAALFSSSRKLVAKPLDEVSRPLLETRNTQVKDLGGNIDADGIHEPESLSGQSIISPPEESLSMAQGHTKGLSTRKRQRKDHGEVEEAYMERLVRMEEREQKQKSNDMKRRKTEQEVDQKIEQEVNQEADIEDSNLDSDSDSNSKHEDAAKSTSPVPQHESLQPSTEAAELERASRTMFLSNISTLAIKSKSSKKILMEHLSSILAKLPEHQPQHKIESLRFRSVAFSTSSVPRKAAFAKKDLLESTMKSTNAYVVYSTPLAAREAAKQLNGTIVLGRHLRADSVAHPAKTDHRRCVFVGNLGFVDDESNMNADEDGKRPRRAKEPADLEEGLWRQFGKAGKVESVRVIRDKTTRVGKGFAYVQFEDQNGVERALQFHEKKYPPMLPRTLRVTRAKNIAKTTSYATRNPRDSSKGTRPRPPKYSQKPSSQVQSLAGRVRKLFGRAGAAQFKKKGNDVLDPGRLVFEGTRADGNKPIQKSKYLKSNGRSARAAAFKKHQKKS